MANTINNQPLFSSLQLTDYLAAWQGSQSPPTRKLTVAGLAAHYLPLTGGTVTGTVTISAGGFAVTGNSSVIGNLTVTGNETVSGSFTAASLGAGPFSGFRNTVINGNFRINQRAYVTNTAKTVGLYMHDRWKAGASGATYTFTQTQPDTTVTITAGTIVQVVEGTNIPSGAMTLSWAGTAQGRVNGGTYGSSPITTNGLPANTNISLEFNTGTLGLVQLEFGTAATPFERRPITTEQLLCYRYFWVLPTALTLSGFTDTGFGVSVTQTVLFPVLMQGVPAVSSVFSAGSGNASEAVSNVSAGGFGVFLSATGVRGGFTVTYNGGNTASAEL